MATFKLIVDSKKADTFAHLGRAEQLHADHLTRFVWEENEISDATKALVLKTTQGGSTCFYLPSKDWKAIFFDMDSTVIEQESIIELSKAAGKAKEVAEITEQAMAGLLDFTSALRERVKMLMGLPDQVIADVAKTLKISKGMHQLSKAAKDRDIKLYLVSGGFNALASGVARELGFDGFIANELDSEEGNLNGLLRGPIINAEAKAQFLSDTCTALGIHPNDTIAVGDGANDLLMMQAAGASLGYFPKTVLLPHTFGAIFAGHDHSALIHAL
jgi:phosphoserine phosphatase